MEKISTVKEKLGLIPCVIPGLKSYFLIPEADWREEELDVKNGFMSFERLCQFWTVPEDHKAFRTKYDIQNDLSLEKPELAIHIFAAVKNTGLCF